MNLAYRWTALAVLGTALGITALAQQSGTVSGRWQGNLQTPGRPMVLIVDLAKNAKGEWIGTYGMPDIGTSDTPLEKIAVQPAAVHFLLTGMPGNPAFDGKLSADGKSLDGAVASGTSKLVISLKRTGAPQVKLPPPNTPIAKEFEGSWHATLDAGGSQIRMVLKLSRGADGVASGKLISVDQNNREVPITSIIQKDKSLSLEIRSVSARYQGTLNSDGAAIAGKWSQLTGSAPLTFERGAFPANSPLPKAFEGSWQATMATDTREKNELKLVLKLTRAADGAAAGVLGNADSGSQELAVTSIVVKDKSLQFLVNALSATFSGTINEAGTEISGTWVQIGTNIPLTFKRKP